MRKIVFFTCAFALVRPTYATDHGPAFGYATPVNSQGELSCDVGLLGRQGSHGTQSTLSSQCGYGITPHITWFVVAPAIFGSGSLPETRMAGGGEFSSSVAWRFQHKVTSVGKRLESTASLGFVDQGPQQDSGVLAGLHRAPGVEATLASGYASRSQYLWFGGGYTRFAEVSQDQRPDIISWSAVYGYRPPGLRRDVNHWDYRGFAELTGEHTGQVRSQGAFLPQSQSTTLWLGPSVLAVFKDIAVEGGVQGPIYRDVSPSIYGHENVRFIVNFSYLKFSSHTHSHSKESRMNKLLALAFLSASVAHAQYTKVDLTVFGMDCAPCAHAVHVSVKGIQGVNTVDVDLDSGLVAIRLAAGNTAGMRQIEEAIEKNGFTHKDAAVTARGTITGSPTAPVLEVTGTRDRYALTSAGSPNDLTALLGKTVDVEGVLPQAAKGKIPDTLRYKSMVEAR